MPSSPLAGQPATASRLVDVSKLLDEYFSRQPDPSVSTQRVAFGTSGHRGSSFKSSFNEWHVLAITQAICDYRREKGINGPVFPGAGHARAVRARGRQCARSAGSERCGHHARGGRRVHAHAGALARHPHLQPCALVRPGGRYRHVPLAQPARQRRLQVQPTQRRSRGHRRDEVGRDARQRLSREAARRACSACRWSARRRRQPPTATTT